MHICLCVCVNLIVFYLNFELKYSPYMINNRHRFKCIDKDRYLQKK